MRLFAIAALLLAAVPAIAAPTPVIQSISGIGMAKTQNIIVTGVGFGKAKKFRNKDVKIIAVADNTLGWQAGYKPAGDTIKLSVSSWADTQIIISGFGGSFGKGTHVLNDGDSVTIAVWNAQSKGLGTTSTCNLVVGAGAVNCP